MEDTSEIGRTLHQKIQQEVIEGIYSELDELWKETRDYDSWSYENENLPDFSDVEVRLESLLDAGHPEELLDIGKELMDRYDGNCRI